MAISAINSVNFTGKKVTKNGNEYDTTNVGKYAGMGVGAAAGTGYGLKVYNAAKKALQEVDANQIFEDTFTTMKENLDKQFGEPIEMATEEYVEACTKASKRAAKVGVGVLGIGGLLAGLGIGAIVDGVINHNRAKNAEKTEA